MRAPRPRLAHRYVLLRFDERGKVVERDFGCATCEEFLQELLTPAHVARGWRVVEEIKDGSSRKPRIIRVVEPPVFEVEEREARSAYPSAWEATCEMLADGTDG